MNVKKNITQEEAGKALASMGPLPLSQKVGYTFDGLANVWMMTIPMFLMTFATENLKIAVGLVGMIMMLVKILDGFSDILAGIIIDNTKSKKGKARPWILWVSVPYAVTLAAVFYIPETAGMAVKVVLLAVLYALSISVFGTIISVARTVLMTRMTNNPKERGQLGVLNDGISAILCGLLMSLTNIWAMKIGYAKIFTIYACVAFLACLITYALCRENVGDLNDIMLGERRSVKVKDLFITLGKNKYAFILLIYILILNIANTIIQTGGIYYAANVLGNQILYSKFMIFMVIGNITGFLIAAPLVRRIGSRKIFIIGSVLGAIAAGTMFFSGGKSFTVICACVLIIAVAGITFTTTQIMAMTGECVDYGEYKNNVRAEGVTSAIVSIGVKIGGALGSALLSGAMYAGGYQSGAAVQSTDVAGAINFAFAGIPMIFYAALAIIYIFTWKLEGKHAEMMEHIMKNRLADI
ncbi:Glucuronide permease [uncultured Roseburia sp.]|uniref:Glycoside-pentoside-hexuronide (GPH):cation symporter n=1 Tax=Brotonthovivens ammoniilytica TaxID=2981725 RepID=A0ABT2TF99_9FIRM|nr:glycoside-pentoside-hexuronide (GPH):cation symporter [Brotonthovivens ammoniilytica]MCU6760860.1 glycoside-pentoside-hexuronide (GPH):cation symporter [Brotonthovivens ammoniilytica]SCI11478.1 Glucuronide permease [uncultured Roseburia sp.]